MAKKSNFLKTRLPNEILKHTKTRIGFNTPTDPTNSIQHSLSTYKMWQT